MDIAEGYSPPLHVLSRWLVPLPFLCNGAKQSAELCKQDRNDGLRLGLVGASTLTPTFLRLPSVVSSRSHLTSAVAYRFVDDPSFNKDRGPIACCVLSTRLATDGPRHLLAVK